MDHKRIYRPCVGIGLFNSKGQVWLGRRADVSEIRPEFEGSSHAWQMPQGGIDEGETPLEAAKRELYEETNVRSITFLQEVSHWLSYDLSQDIIKKSWQGKYCGQKQKWFAFLFKGNESEIDIHNPAGGHTKAEFSAWRWAELEEVPKLTVPFKREVYECVEEEFAPLVKQLKAKWA